MWSFYLFYNFHLGSNNGAASLETLLLPFEEMLYSASLLLSFADAWLSVLPHIVAELWRGLLSKSKSTWIILNLLIHLQYAFTELIICMIGQNDKSIAY